jgi:hypothetical protein
VNLGERVKELDRRLRSLGAVDVDRNLGGLETAVWARVDGSCCPALPHRVAMGLCAAAALFFLALGTTAGLAHAQPDPGVFEIHAPLAPSTILGG